MTMTSMFPQQEKRAANREETDVSWIQDEVHVLPENRLSIVTFALVCTMFLGTLDRAIVSTALPTIIAHLEGGSDYSWVGNAYMLSAGAFSPLYGKLSNMLGRKPLLYLCILLFLFGSALCGAAQCMPWLIASRAFQGIGGGGVLQLSIITISDIVPLKDRGFYVGIINATYGIASVIGPLLGGVLVQHASWRWCFFVNLPVGGIAATLLFFFLNVHPPPKRPVLAQIAELDFIGLFCLFTGVICLLVGFSFGEEKWSKPRTIGLIAAGVVLLVIAGVNEVFSRRVAILPPRLFKTRTTACILASAFLQSFVFWATMYYLPLFYQVLGSSPTIAGIKMLPYILLSSVSAIVSGFVASKMGKNLPGIWLGNGLSTVGTGLMIMLDSTSSIAAQEVFPMVAAIGTGILFQIPIVALQAAMPLKDMATATSGFMLLHILGGVIGIAVGEIILASVLPRKLAAIPNISSLGLGDKIADLNDKIGRVHLISNAVLRNAVLHAWAQSIAMIWVVTTASAGAALILTFFLREYPVARKTVYGTGVRGMGDSEQNLVMEEELKKFLE